MAGSKGGIHTQAGGTIVEHDDNGAFTEKDGHVPPIIKGDGGGILEGGPVNRGPVDGKGWEKGYRTP